MNAHALAVLEFSRVLDLVAQRAASTLGAERVRALTPGTDRAWLEAEHGRVAAVRAMREGDHPWHPEPLPDVTAALGRLRVAGSRWTAEELRQGGQLLRSARLTREALRDEKAPRRRARGARAVRRPSAVAAHGRGRDRPHLRRRRPGARRRVAGVEAPAPRTPEVRRRARAHTGARDGGPAGAPPAGGPLHHRAQRALRDPGPPRGARRRGRHRARRVRQRRDPVHRAPRGGGIREPPARTRSRRARGDRAHPGGADRARAAAAGADARVTRRAGRARQPVRPGAVLRRLRVRQRHPRGAGRRIRDRARPAPAARGAGNSRGAVRPRHGSRRAHAAGVGTEHRWQDGTPQSPGPHLRA